MSPFGPIAKDTSPRMPWGCLLVISLVSKKLFKGKIAFASGILAAARKVVNEQTYYFADCKLSKSIIGN